MTTTTKTARGGRQRTCSAGEHFVTAELAKQGWVASRTDGNTAGLDIQATRPPDEDPEGETSIRIDVKTDRQGRPYAWQVGGIHLSGPRDFIVFVGLDKTGEAPSYWIVPAEVAADVVKEYRKNGRVTRRTVRRRDIEQFAGRWELLDDGWE